MLLMYHGSSIPIDRSNNFVSPFILASIFLVYHIFYDFGSRTIKELAEVSKENSCEEDFGNGISTNYPKIDHEKKWNHSRSKIKTESLDELLENYEEDIPQQELDIESMAIANVTLKEIIDNANEQEKAILKMLSEGYTQSEIAKDMGISQSTVSKKLTNIKNTYKT